MQIRSGSSEKNAGMAFRLPTGRPLQQTDFLQLFMSIQPAITAKTVSGKIYFRKNRIKFTKILKSAIDFFHFSYIINKEQQRICR